MSFIAAMAASAALQTNTTNFNALLDQISHRAFNYFWTESPAPMYLTSDRANDFSGTTPTTVPASVSATGYALSAYTLGTARGWIPRATALTRVKDVEQILLYKAANYHGWFYHFLSKTDGSRMWSSEASTIDTSICLNGLMMAEAYFNDPTITMYAEKILARVDWHTMLTDGGTKPTSLTFTHGYYPESGYISYRWDSFCELIHLYLAAYSLYPQMPAASFNAWARNQTSYGGYDILVGGPLFMHQMSQGFYDFENKRDGLGYDYWVETRNDTFAQRSYCITNPGHFTGYGQHIWGLSACDNPNGYNANGAPVQVNDNGTLAPASAIASVAYTPTVCIDAMNVYRSWYPNSYGRYGFVSGINPTQNWTDTDVVGIDLGQVMLNIENYRDNLPHMLMMNQARITNGMTAAGFHVTDEGDPGTRPLRKV